MIRRWWVRGICTAANGGSCRHLALLKGVRESPTYTSTREDYLLTDAQGSTYAIVKDTGSVLGIMGFDPWGLRPVPTDRTPLADPLTLTVRRPQCAAGLAGTRHSCRAARWTLDWRART